MSTIRGLILLTLTCLVSTASVRNTDSVIEGTDLVFAFMVHRHGDRTPIPSSMMSLLGLGDCSEVLALIEPWGYGQLTDLGKQTGYKTGEFIRQRYDELIAARYNKSEMYIRSTDSTRTKMTVLIAMSAVYPAGEGSWSDTINWEPVPYTTVPVKYDFNEAVFNCPVLITANHAFMATANSRMDPFGELLTNVSDITGQDFTRTPHTFITIYDVYDSLNSLGYDIPEEIRELMPELEEAAAVSWDITVGDKQYLALQSGPLLNEFFTYADEIIAGYDTPKVRVYSAHDVNVYSAFSIARASPRPGVVKYGSLFALELRLMKATGQYVVLPVYVADPKEGTESYLQVDGCGDGYLCDYESFLSLTAADLRTEDVWRHECGFTEDLEIDSSSID